MRNTTQLTQALIVTALVAGLATVGCWPALAQRSGQGPGDSSAAATAVVEKILGEAAGQAAEQTQHTTDRGDVVNMHGDVEIPADQTVEGDVVAIGGAARVHGKVKGSVIAVGGSIYLPNGSEVAGDVVSFGGNVTREPKTTVGGSTLQMPGIGEGKPAVESTGDEPRAEETTTAETRPAEEPAPAPSSKHRAEVVQFGQPVRVAADEIVDGGVVAMGGSVDIEGEVRGDVVCIGGPLSIDGEVSGSAVAIGGPLQLKDDAEVRGDAVSLGGPLTTAGGANVRGQTVTVGGPLGNVPLGSIGNIVGKGGSLVPGLAPLIGILGAAASWLCTALAMLIVVALVVLVFPGHTETIATCLDAAPRRTFLYGLIAWLLVLPILVILIVLIVTWILVPVYLLALAALLIMGYVGLSLYLGKRVVRLTRWQVGSTLGLTLIGFVLLSLMDLIKPLPVIGFVAGLVTAIVLIFSLGAALMTRFGTDPTGAWLSGRTVTAEVTIDGPPSEPAAAGQVEDAPMSPPTGEGQGEPPDDEFDETTRRALEELPPEDGSVPPAEPEAPADEEEAG